MHISKVQAINLKGRSFALDLTPATLVVGPNRSGKSAILDAIRLTLIGYVPEIGKKNSATFELSSGREMTTALKIADSTPEGILIERLYLMEKGTVKGSYATKGAGGGIEDGALATPMLDASTYFEMTESQRIDYVFARVAMPPEFTEDGIIARLQRLGFDEQHTEEVEKAKGEVIAACKQQFSSSEGDIPAALSTLTGDTLKTDLATWNKRAKETIGTVRVLSELKNREGECSAETLTDLRNEQERLSGLLDECNKEFGALTEQAAAATRAAKTKAALLVAISKPEPDWMVPVITMPPPTIADDTSAIEQELQKIKGELAGIPQPNPKLEADARLAAAQLASASKAAAATVALAHEKLNQIEGIQAHETCPYCLSSEPGWQERVVAQLTKELDALKANVVTAMEAEQVAQEADAAASALLDESRESDAMYYDLTEQRDRLLSCLNEAAQQNATAQERYRAAVAKAEREHAAAVNALESSRAKWQAQRNADVDALARIQEIPEPAPEELSALAAKSDDLLAERNAVNANIQTGQRLQQDLQRAAQAAAEHRLAVARALVVKEVKADLQEQKGEMVAAAFGELLKTANGIVGDLLPSPLAYNAEDNEIGYLGAAGFVPHRTFSGSERALAYCAIAAALAQKAPLRLLILDELGRLTPAMQFKALMHFGGALEAGVLDQVIAILPIDKGAPVITPSPYSLIQVGMGNSTPVPDDQDEDLPPSMAAMIRDNGDAK